MLCGFASTFFFFFFFFIYNLYNLIIVYLDILFITSRDNPLLLFYIMYITYIIDLDSPKQQVRVWLLAAANAVFIIIIIIIIITTTTAVFYS